jgi:hypothetical protein
MPAAQGSTRTPTFNAPGFFFSGEGTRTDSLRVELEGVGAFKKPEPIRSVQDEQGKEEEGHTCPIAHTTVLLPSVPFPLRLADKRGQR